MSDYSYIIVAYSLTALAAIYMVSYYSTLFSNCSKFPEFTQEQLDKLTKQQTQTTEILMPKDTITEKECCEGTWGSITSSVQLTLYILAGALIVMYMIFYWGQTGDWSWKVVGPMIVYFAFIGIYVLLRDVAKADIFR